MLELCIRRNMVKVVMQYTKKKKVFKDVHDMCTSREEYSSSSTLFWIDASKDSALASVYPVELYI